MLLAASFSLLLLYYYYHRHSGVAVPTLDETLKAIKELDLFLFLEVKSLNKAVW